MKSQKDAIRHISIHVTNLTASIATYQHVLGATVLVNETSNTAMCTWDTLSTDASSSAGNKDIVRSHVGVELHPLPSGTEMIQGAAQGRFAIETDDFAIAGIAQRAQQAETLGICKVLHGPVKLQPHGEEGPIPFHIVLFHNTPFISCSFVTHPLTHSFYNISLHTLVYSTPWTHVLTTYP